MDAKLIKKREKMTEFQRQLKKLHTFTLNADWQDNPPADGYIRGELIKTFKDWQPPKEKVKIPQFVADWIGKLKHSDREHDRTCVSCAMNHVDMPQDVRTWLSDYEIDSGKHIENSYKFARAFLDDYEVEKEKLYYIPVDKIIPFFENISSYMMSKKLTENQIKAIDEHLWSLAVEVESEAD